MLSNLKVKGIVYRYFRNVDNSYYKDEDNYASGGYKWVEKVKVKKIDKVEVFSGTYDFKEAVKGEVTLENSVSLINSESNRNDIKVAIKNLKLNLDENIKLIDSIKGNYRYSDEYKNEEINKVLKDSLKTENLISEFNDYLNCKDVKKEITLLRKISRELKIELQNFFNERWKYNKNYISICEKNFIEKYPDFNIDFKEKSYIDNKRLLKMVTLK